VGMQSAPLAVDADFFCGWIDFRVSAPTPVSMATGRPVSCAFACNYCIAIANQTNGSFNEIRDKKCLYGSGNKKRVAALLQLFRHKNAFYVSAALSVRPCSVRRRPLLSYFARLCFCYS
jgi:hypothetical protein